MVVPGPTSVRTPPPPVATVWKESDADAGALHVRLADEAWRLGPAPAAESYLDVARLLEVARQCGADAVFH